MSKRAILTPAAWASVVVAILGVTFFVLSLGDFSSILEPEQTKTATIAFSFLVAWGLGWLGLEFWTLLNTDHPKDHISPTITKLIKESPRFRIAFVGFVLFGISLIIHFAGWVEW